MSARVEQTYEQALAEDMARAGITILGHGTYRVPSSRGPGTTYIVGYAGRGDEVEVALWTCTCPSRGTCKHIDLVSGIVDALNEEFGYE